MVTALCSRVKLSNIRFNFWAFVTAVLSLILLGPIVAVFATAAGDSGGLWLHLFQTVIPRYIANTLTLMLGVGLLSLLLGVSSAWVVTRYVFPCRRAFEWMLLLPATVPAYLISYTYTDFLEYAGPLQGFLRNFFGWESARDYWFPEIRSMGGAILVMASVLYPYIYMMARSAFLLTPHSLFEAGQLTKRNMFWGIGLPLARPAIAVGLALVLMETISDFGTVEYFAIETLTLGIFNVWLGMNNLTAAAQIAAFAFIFIAVLLIIEIMARSRRRFSNTSRTHEPIQAKLMMGWHSFTCIFLCSIPVFMGFVLPVCILLNFIIDGHSLLFDQNVANAAFNTFTLSTIVAFSVMMIAGLMVLTSIYARNKLLQYLTALASIGYAFPGTILAIGVIAFSGYADEGIAVLMDRAFKQYHTGWLTGGIGLIVFACIVRFQAVGYGAITSGHERLPPNMVQASRTLGRSFGQSIWSILLPLMRIPIIAGGLLVFVDVMKELPMTLLLRPFNYETLATFVYQYAKDELLEEAALPALVIVITGIVPVILMNSTLRGLSQKKPLQLGD